MNLLKPTHIKWPGLIHKSTTTHEEITMLEESNAIEDVFDQDSLQQAIYAWEWLNEQKTLRPHEVLKTHKILMLHQPLRPNEKGYFRTCQVWVGGREGVNWRSVPRAIEVWCNAATKPGVDPIFSHVEYERIHPFVDGNGRTGRIFLNWQLKHILHKPILTFLADERQEYYKLFQ